MTTEAQYSTHLQNIPSNVVVDMRGFRFDAKTIADPRSRMDANTVPFLAQQLEQIQARSYEVPRAELPFMEGAVIPIETDIDPGADTYSYYVYNGRGQAEFVTSYASDDMPVVDVEAKKTTLVCESIQIGYTLDRQELRAAAFGNLDLAGRRAKQAMISHREKHELVAAYGSKKRNINGFLNHENVPEILPSVDGAGFTRWDIKDPIFIARDLANMAVAMHNVTKGIRTANALLIPGDLWTLLRWKPFQSTSGTTVTSSPEMSILKYIMSVTDMVVGSLLLLQPSLSKGNLVAGQGTAVAYIAGDADMVSYKEVMKPTFYEPQWKGLKSKTPGESRTGGVQFIEPFSCIRMPGVSN